MLLLPQMSSRTRRLEHGWQTSDVVRSQAEAFNSGIEVDLDSLKDSEDRCWTQNYEEAFSGNRSRKVAQGQSLTAAS